MFKGRDGKEYDIYPGCLETMSEEDLNNLLPPYSKLAGEEAAYEYIKLCIDMMFKIDIMTGFSPYEAFIRASRDYLDWSNALSETPHKGEEDIEAHLNRAKHLSTVEKLEEVFKKS